MDQLRNDVVNILSAMFDNTRKQSDANLERLWIQGRVLSYVHRDVEDILKKLDNIFQRITILEDQYKRRQDPGIVPRHKPIFDGPKY